MKKTMIALLVAASSGGCSEPAGVDALLLRGVVVDDLFYTPRDELTTQAETETVGEKYTEVVRHVDCTDGVWLDENTHVADYCPLENGESNYLPTGTPIHRLEGKEPGEALTVFHGNRWEVLEPEPAAAPSGTTGFVAPPPPSPSIGGDR